MLDFILRVLLMYWVLSIIISPIILILGSFLYHISTPKTRLLLAESQKVWHDSLLWYALFLPLCMSVAVNCAPEQPKTQQVQKQEPLGVIGVHRPERSVSFVNKDVKIVNIPSETINK